MSEKAHPPARSKESLPSPAAKAARVPVSCGMEGCDHAAAVQFLGDSPFEGFKFDAQGWTVVEDTEDHRTVFLCSDCSKEFEQEAGRDDADLEEDDEDLEEEDEPDGE